MKKIILFILNAFLFIGGSYSQDIQKVFLDMPEDLTPLLTSVNKADFIDFLASEMKSEVKNKLDKTSEMKILGKDYIFIQMSEKSTWQMKLLPLADSFVILIIETVQGPAEDSSLRFYDVNWSRQNSCKFIQKPSLKDFIKRAQYDEYNSKSADLELLDMELFKYSLNKTNTDLQVKFTTIDYLSSDIKNKFDSYLKLNRTYKWINGCFELQP